MLFYILNNTNLSLVAQIIKNLPAMQETWVPSLGWKDLVEKGMTSHSLENPTDRGAWWAAVHGVARSRTQLTG